MGHFDISLPNFEDGFLADAESEKRQDFLLPPLPPHCHSFGAVLPFFLRCTTVDAPPPQSSEKPSFLHLLSSTAFLAFHGASLHPITPPAATAIVPLHSRRPPSFIASCTFNPVSASKNHCAVAPSETPFASSATKNKSGLQRRD
ncbi:hypothetical protein PIB30_031868 [Stylosanthes scabra]|uniref:Uncharacterized protein n=1 Tax=Stylosanthes scabra TaxID=79078 RepID=A0ABU6VB66_9FABA|nr:hypothetical protein [Stylosanthes scabra]